MKQRSSQSEVNLPSAVVTAINSLYAIFKRCRRPHELDVCTYCCMPEELENEMRSLPLQQLQRHHFYEYGDSAKSENQPVEELKYFLPRMAELFARGERIRHSLELTFDRLGNCDRSMFNAKEWFVIEGFAHAHFVWCLTSSPDCRYAPLQSENVFTHLLMWHIGGVDIRPMLDLWTLEETPAATLLFVESTYYDYICGGNKVSNAFAKSFPAYAESIDAWLGDKAVKNQFASKLLALGSQAQYRGVGMSAKHGDMEDRMGVVFDLMAY